jgi:superfamily II DNA or RNA helicase
MQCGPIRFRDDARKQAAKRPFDHFVIPRFTSFRTPEWFDRDKKDVSIHELYAEIVLDVMRNQQIIDDVVHCHENGRNCIVLTERTAHVEIIAKELCTRITEVFSVMGSTSVKEAKETINSISHVSADKPITIVSTGRYIGEGFDEPRLDTLFIAMPISWKGTLQQYAGRLHRLYEGKSEVQFYDYVDIHVTMFEKMYNRRLSGYASIGYKIKGDISGAENLDIIFDKNNFLPVYSNDIKNAKREIMILSPFITEKRTKYILQNLKQALVNNIIVSVITRPAGDFPGKNLSSWNDTIELLKLAGVILVFKSNIHQKFSIIDQRIVWYGSINLLSYGNSEESIMRINSANIAFELIKSIEKQD